VMGTARGMGPKSRHPLSQRAAQELIDAREPPAPADPGKELAKTWEMANGSQGSEFHRWRASARKAHLTVTGPGDVTVVLR
jgi:hypothetical protein